VTRPAPPYWRLLVLTCIAAATDAVSYLGLGNVFPANMTGNTVLLAIGLTAGAPADAARSAAALGGFVLGAALAGSLGGGRRWDRATTAWLLAEVSLLLAAGIWWAQLGVHPRGGARFGLIGLVSSAMGVQSAVVSRLDVGVSTTYITGTWTAVSAWAGRLVRGTAQRGEQSHRVQVGVLVCYFGAALLAGLAYHAADGA
jgi:uncharacterized membrane protein YoaK (UPF0700 family)